MNRELSSLPIPAVERGKLHAAGFSLVEDVISLKPSHISRETGLSMEESLAILQLVKAETEKVTGSTSSKSQQLQQSQARPSTALDLLRDEQTQQSIITFSQSIDELLGGGVPLTKITEFCGAPGIGKTQMCIQLSIDVQIPQCFGGVAGEAVYIDTEGSFIIERVAAIARATVSHCQQIANMEKQPDQLETMKELTFERLLSGIHYIRCHDHIELIATTHTLPDFIKKHPKVKLVVVDSIAFHFRHDFDDYALRTRLLNGMAQSFIKMAALNKLAVVLTNQMTTKISNDSRGSSSHLVPALGESWGHASTIRVILYWNNCRRYAMLYKSPSRQEAVVPYQITTGGVRDVSGSQGDTSSANQNPQDNQGPQQANKRQRTDD